MDDFDLATLHAINGLYIGQLTEREKKVFDRAIKDGVANRDYKSGAGFLGCAKVSVSFPEAIS